MDKGERQGFILSIVVALASFALALVKLYIGMVTNSVTIYIDAINNFGDIFGGALGAFGIYMSAKAVTKRYPNGFGRMEYIVSFVLSVVTIIVGVLFIFDGIEKLMYPMPVKFDWVYLILLVLTVALKLVMGFSFVKVAKKSKSSICKALYLDSFLDAGITTSIVLCYALSMVDSYMVDAIFGIVIGLIVMAFSAILVWRSIHSLLGYNSDIDLDDLSGRLLSEQVFSAIDHIKVNDYGRKNREILVFGKYDENKLALLCEIGESINATIYPIDAKESNNIVGEDNE